MGTAAVKLSDTAGGGKAQRCRIQRHADLNHQGSHTDHNASQEPPWAVLWTRVHPNWRTDEDLAKATRIAIREAITLLGDEFGLERGPAYQLVSVACDLRITQLVDQKVGVHVMIPKALFEGAGG